MWYVSIDLFYYRESNNLIAVINLQLDKALAEKGRSLSENDQQMDSLKALLQNSVETGRVGALKVDPGYLLFEPESCKFIFAFPGILYNFFLHI